MNSFESKMVWWATEGEGKEQVKIMMDCMREEDDATLDNLDEEFVGWNILDIFTCHYDNEDLLEFLSIMVAQIDEGRLGKAIVEYYKTHNM